MDRHRSAKFLATAVLTVSMVGAAVTGSMAATTSQKAAQAKKEASEAGSKASSLYAQVDEAEDKIDDLQSQINQTSADLAQTQKDLETKKAQVSAQTDSLNSRLSAMYKTGSVGMIDVILSSDNVSDLITNVAMVHKVYQQDQELLTSLKDDYAEIQELEKTQQQQQKQLEEDKAKVQETKDSLASQADEYKALEDQKTQEANQLAAQAEAERVAAEQKLAAEEAKKNNSSSSGSSSSGSSGGSSSSGSSSSSSSGYRWPVNGGVVTSPYGYRIHPIFGYRIFHGGVDIGLPTGTPVYAVSDGIVTMASWYQGYGNCIQISIGNGYTTLYGHLSRYAVSKGQYVRKGQVVGYVGSTGNSTGPHLHFTLFHYGTTVNPYSIF